MAYESATTQCFQIASEISAIKTSKFLMRNKVKLNKVKMDKMVYCLLPLHALPISFLDFTEIKTKTSFVCNTSSVLFI